MKLSIHRSVREPEPREETVTYEATLENATLLEQMIALKATVDPSLSFAHECRSGVCGSCAVRVNGTEVLACIHKAHDGDLVEPMRNVPVLRDLIVDMDAALQTTVRVQAWGGESEEMREVTPEAEKANEIQSDCILCGACYSACPVYAVNPDFLGPFALTRSWRYVADARCEGGIGKIEAIQPNGIWDCTLCNECVPVCPQGIAPKQDIVMLRNKSGMLGYTDPNFGAGGLDFGFNPGF